MLLRVEVYPYLPSSSSSTQSGALPSANATEPSEILHATVLTQQSRQQDTSTSSAFLTVGRKHGDIVLLGDKSVSRDHGRIQVVSSQSSITSACPDLVVAPRNDEEQQLCQTQPMALVWETLGKVGCCVVQAKPNKTNNNNNKQKSPTNDDDDATDEDATDDEMDPLVSSSQHRSQPSQIGSNHAAVSSLAPRSQQLVQQVFGSHANLQIDFVPHEKSLLLPFFCTSSTDSTFPPSPVIVQCGKLGSTLVLSHVPIRYKTGRSGLPKSKGLSHTLTLLGAVPATTWEETTYFVVQARMTNPAHLAAWSRHIPTATPHYWQALSDRPTYASPLPQLVDYPPKSDHHSFWNHTPNPNLWKDWTLLCFQKADEDLMAMVQAAGGTAVALYDHDDDPLETAVNILRQQSPQTVFAGRLSTKRLTKAYQAVLDRLVQDYQLPIYSAKELVTRLSQQVLPNGSEVSTTEAGNPVDSDKTTCLKTTEMGTLKDSNSTPKAVEQTETVDKSASEKPKTPSKSLPQKKHDQEITPVVEEMDSELSKDDVAAKANAHAAPQEGPDKQSQQEHSAWQTTQRAGKVNSQTTEAAVTEEKEPSTETFHSSHNDNQAGGSRKTLIQQNGWFVVAPRGAKRKSYIRSLEEIQEATGRESTELITGAPSEQRADLVVTSQAVSRDEQQIQPLSLSGPNFKKFRKNPVPPRLQQPLQRFVAVLPKESEIRRELESQRHEVEQQQRRADELFQDPSRGRRRQ